MANGKFSKQWKDSASIAFAILATIETFLAVSGISLDSIIPSQKWWVLLIVIIAVYAVILVIVYLILKAVSMRGIRMDVNGISVAINQGDIFEANGWKVIPFNEHFDITVDDVIISKTSLNGLFIMNHVADLNELSEVIRNDGTKYAPNFGTHEHLTFPLGHCIAFQGEYILLALTRFNEQNVAHISKIDYEHCLMNMWKEIRRLYANKPVFLPLIGSGITSFDDIPQKSNFDLLKCMLCTLKASGENINQPVTILLTKEVMQEIHLYEVKGAL